MKKKQRKHKKHVITEAHIRKNKVITEKNMSAPLRAAPNDEIDNIRTKLMHLKTAYNQGILTESAYNITARRLEKSLEDEINARKGLKKNKEDESELSGNAGDLKDVMSADYMAEVKEGMGRHGSRNDKDEDLPTEEMPVELRMLLDKAKNEEDLKNYGVLKKDFYALEKLYDDGIIDERTLELNKKNIIKNIKYFEDLRKKKLEKNELEEIKKKIDEEIFQATHSGDFLAGEMELKEDLDSLKRIYDKGLIFKNEYLAKKKEIEDRIRKPDILITKVNMVFEEYKNDIDKEIKNTENILKASNKLDSSVFEKRKKGVLEKIKTAILGENEDDEVLIEDEDLKKLAEIHENITSPSAISDMAFIVKDVIEKKLGFGDEYTSEELVREVEKTKMDSALKDKILLFFTKVSHGEYTGSLKAIEIPKAYKDAESIIIEIKKAKITKELNNAPKEGAEKKEDKKETKSPEQPPETKKAEPENNAEEPKKGVLEKINDFFGL